MHPIFRARSDEVFLVFEFPVSFLIEMKLLGEPTQNDHNSDISSGRK